MGLEGLVPDVKSRFGLAMSSASIEKPFRKEGRRHGTPGVSEKRHCKVVLQFMCGVLDGALS